METRTGKIISLKCLLLVTTFWLLLGKLKYQNSNSPDSSVRNSYT